MPIKGSGPTMRWLQRGQGPSKPAAAKGTRSIAWHAGHGNWITSGIGSGAAA